MLWSGATFRRVCVIKASSGHAVNGNGRRRNKKWFIRFWNFVWFPLIIVRSRNVFGSPAVVSCCISTLVHCCVFWLKSLSNDFEVLL